ncbi:MAG: molybdenum cofactor guanylyltransferase [Desulfobacteraceae bacterium]|jgi:molybdopterin-guanine dinucleotide biosynthesis protein A
MSTTLRDSAYKNAPIKGITGLILVGGKSRRYGSNKALVKVDGIRLIDRAVRVVRSVFQDVVLVTNSPHEYAYLGVPMVEDLIKGLGPLGGVYTGLESMSDEAGFFVACDMPFLNEALVRHIVSQRDDFDAVVPRMGWMIEPLHAVYSKNCLPAIRELIDSQEYQIVKFLHKVRIRYLDEDEIRAFDPQLRSFFNINEPQDLPNAVKLAKSSPFK